MRTHDAQLLVLSTLADGPRHGYAINAAIEERGGNRLGPGSLYGALTRLEAKGLIEPAGNLGRQQRVRLTPAGRAELDRELRAMSQVFETTAPDQVTYLDRAAASAAGQSYKPLLFDALDINSGHTVVDLGCGPGTDLPSMAAAAGRVFGVDHDREMTTLAAERTASLGNVDIVLADIHGLPMPDSTIDRIRTDRVLQHVTDPARVLTEAHRVLRPGGRLVMGEPDWETLAVDHPSGEIARAYTRFIADKVVRNAHIGRTLPRLAVDAGFAVPQVIPVTPVFREVKTADQILGFERNTERAVTAGYLTSEQAQRWLTHLATAEFLATVTQFIVVATVPQDEPLKAGPDRLSLVSAARVYRRKWGIDTGVSIAASYRATLMRSTEPGRSSRCSGSSSGPRINSSTMTGTP